MWSEILTAVALVLVIEGLLPFASPGDPLTAARISYLRQRGDDPFKNYQVPHAALLLRQGFGRLIRTQRDQGIVVILDPRIHTKRYGRMFLDSLPPCEIVQEDAATEPSPEA